MVDETLQDYLETRKNWMRVDVVPEGDGHSIVLRIDGVYFDPAEAEEMRAYHEQELAPLVAALPGHAYDWHHRRSKSKTA